MHILLPFLMRETLSRFVEKWGHCCESDSVEKWGHCCESDSVDKWGHCCESDSVEKWEHSCESDSVEKWGHCCESDSVEKWGHCCESDSPLNINLNFKEMLRNVQNVVKLYLRFKQQDKTLEKV